MSKIKGTHNFLFIKNLHAYFYDAFSQSNNFFKFFVKKCYSPSELFSLFNVPNQTGVNKSTFGQMSSSLVWMGITPECKTKSASNETTTPKCDNVVESKTLQYNQNNKLI